MKPQALFSTFIALIMMIVTASSSLAQDQPSDEAATDAAHAALKEKLMGISEDIFLREKTLDNGLKLYQLIWEMDGETSKITFELRRLGTFDNKPMFGVYAYTVVAGIEQGSMPPAVIKAVATKNERTGLGYFSMPESFDTVYMNFTAPSDTLTSGQLWMICGWMHQNRVQFNNEIQTILNASGQ